MADFSYSMYAVHASLITFVCAALDKWTGFGWREVPIEMWHWGVVVMVLLGVIFISRILAMFTEDKSMYIKSAAYRMSGVSRAMQENKKPQGC
jgi:peptidoglycan/LPS O-acetylase OafA/YrhL